MTSYFLYVHDDGGSGNYYFKKQYKVKDVLYKMVEENKKEMDLPNTEFEGEYIYADLLCFKEVDKRFTKFVFDTFLDDDTFDCHHIYDVTKEYLKAVDLRNEGQGDSSKQ